MQIFLLLGLILVFSPGVLSILKDFNILMFYDTTVHFSETSTASKSSSEIIKAWRVASDLDLSIFLIS